jgi:DNA-binding NarL/FixJ family response regulator
VNHDCKQAGRIPQDHRRLGVASELRANALTLLVAWSQAKAELETGVPGTVANNPWHPVKPNDHQSRPQPLPELSRQIAATYAAGLTQQQVAARFHLHVQTVRRHLRLAGSPARTRQSPPN